MIQQKQLDVKRIKVLILDEADEMFSKGFKEQVYTIRRHLPSKAQVVLVSATLPEEVLDMTQEFMTNPFRLLVKREEVSLQGIKQYYIDVQQEKWKFDTLCDLYENLTV